VINLILIYLFMVDLTLLLLAKIIQHQISSWLVTKVKMKVKPMCLTN
jgi:hypothetical protein